MTRRTGAKPLTNQFAGNGKVTDEMSVTLFLLAPLFGGCLGVFLIY